MGRRFKTGCSYIYDLLQLGLQRGDVAHGATQEQEQDPEGPIAEELGNGAEEGAALGINGRGGAGGGRGGRQGGADAADGEKEAGEGGEEPDQVEEGDVGGPGDEEGGEGLAQHQAQRVGHAQDEGGHGPLRLPEPVLAHLPNTSMYGTYV